MSARSKPWGYPVTVMCPDCESVRDIRSWDRNLQRKRCVPCAGIAKRGKNNANWKGGISKNVKHPEWDARLRQECELCASRDRVANHHIIYRQHVRKRGGDQWDPRNAMTLCVSCHAKQHGGTRFRILACDLPEEFWAFGRELLGDALWDYLARFYDDGNSKLGDLLDNH